MTREEYVKNLIKSKGMNIKEFSTFIDIPYSTILSILNNNIGGASVDNVIKICKALDINVESLQNRTLSTNDIHALSNNEIKYIKKYRALDERGQQTIDMVLDVQYELVSSKKQTSADSYPLDMEESVVHYNASQLARKRTACSARSLMRLKRGKCRQLPLAQTHARSGRMNSRTPCGCVEQKWIN